MQGVGSKRYLPCRGIRSRREPGILAFLPRTEASTPTYLFVCLIEMTSLGLFVELSFNLPQAGASNGSGLILNTLRTGTCTFSFTHKPKMSGRA